MKPSDYLEQARRRNGRGGIVDLSQVRVAPEITLFLAALDRWDDLVATGAKFSAILELLPAEDLEARKGLEQMVLVTDAALVRVAAVFAKATNRALVAMVQNVMTNVETLEKALAELET